jgi:hypothetical protein
MCWDGRQGRTQAAHGAHLSAGRGRAGADRPGSAQDDGEDSAGAVKPRPSRIRRTRRWPSWSATGDRFFLCTQNVDDLHERAGSRAAGAHARRPLQGALRAGVRRPPVEDHAIYRSLVEVGRCPCGGRLCARTLFSLARFRWRWSAFRQEIRKATLMVVVGTSGSVYPAANFVHLGAAEWRAHRLRWTGSAAERLGIYARRPGQGRRGAARTLSAWIACKISFRQTKMLLEKPDFFSSARVAPTGLTGNFGPQIPTLKRGAN